MKKFISIFLFLSCMTFIYANDTYFYFASGQLVPTEEKDIEVEMSEETINIVLEKSYYEVTVDFSFYNYGNTIDLEIGFPFFGEGISGNGEIRDFKCWTNGVETDYTDYPIKKEWSESSELEKAYVRTITFPSKQTTKTKINYKSTYGREAPSYSIAKYLYGTGSSWKNSIGKMTVRIQNNNLYSCPRQTAFPYQSDIKRIDDHTWESTFVNVEPKRYTDCITIICGDIFHDDGPRILQKNRYFGCRQKLTAGDLFWYTQPQLRLIRNAIYAFSGYPFKSPDLIELFEKTEAGYGWFGWTNGEAVYPLDKNFTEDKLTDIEKANVKLILEEENKLKKLN